MHAWYASMDGSTFARANLLLLRVRLDFLEDGTSLTRSLRLRVRRWLSSSSSVTCSTSSSTLVFSITGGRAPNWERQPAT